MSAQHIAPRLFDLMVAALAELSEPQRHVFELTHGIDCEGQTPRGEIDLQCAADQLGMKRGTARWHLAMAERAVYRYIAMTLAGEAEADVIANAMPDPGPTVVDSDSNDLTFSYLRTGYGSGVILGERSERFVRESKRSDAKGRTDALVQVHREIVGAIA